VGVRGGAGRDGDEAARLDDAVERAAVHHQVLDDRIIQAGGFVSVPAGSAPDAHSVPVRKEDADSAFDAATCIGCGACVAACPNGSASLFTAAKITHLSLLPQGQPERLSRAKAMVDQMDAEGFGGCTNTGECTAVCPKGIPLDTIAQMNSDYLKANAK
jgi:succinate dehydrogenase / fumarate reductase iron-sulfur subunit